MENLETYEYQKNRLISSDSAIYATCPCRGVVIPSTDQQHCWEVVQRTESTWLNADLTCQSIGGHLGHPDNSFMGLLRSYITKDYAKPVLTGIVIGNAEAELYAVMCPNNVFYGVLPEQNIFSEESKNVTETGTCLYITEGNDSLTLGECTLDANVLCDRLTPAITAKIKSSKECLQLWETLGCGPNQWIIFGLCVDWRLLLLFTVVLLSLFLSFCMLHFCCKLCTSPCQSNESKKRNKEKIEDPLVTVVQPFPKRPEELGTYEKENPAAVLPPPTTSTQPGVNTSPQLSVRKRKTKIVDKVQLRQPRAFHSSLPEIDGDLGDDVSITLERSDSAETVLPKGDTVPNVFTRNSRPLRLLDADDAQQRSEGIKPFRHNGDDKSAPPKGTAPFGDRKIRSPPPLGTSLHRNEKPSSGASTCSEPRVRPSEIDSISTTGGTVSMKNPQGRMGGAVRTGGGGGHVPVGWKPWARGSSLSQPQQFLNDN
ncbi:CLT [Parelaphostrongylus tenuis]|uniref:CLT n=1 Tax=Parelaphostrongylus tenuis TaxID=148309 RepID=A0AAD5QK89_PARTN|nr:CLT [Parelaphostrongylus tenuis]